MRPLGHARHGWRGFPAPAVSAEEYQVLVLNSGSSSLKFGIHSLGAAEGDFAGQVEGLESENCRLLLKGQEPEALPNASLADAVQAVLAKLPEGGEGLVGIGHRVVHGGPTLHKPTLVTEEVVEEIRKAVPLAPLHNPSAVIGIEASMKALPALRHRNVACFDTGYHYDMYAYAREYAIPRDIAEKLHIRRYGFHGISCQSGYRRGCEALHLRPDSETTRVVLMHLGAGCSATAIIGNRSVDTTMGLTPLDGLVMGTRCGSLDPGIQQYMQEQLNLSAGEVDTILNKKSGLLGVSGVSSDMRTLLDKIENGTPDEKERCKLAVKIWLYRLTKMIASLFLPLQHVTGLIFTGGIAENSPQIRQYILKSFQFRGVEVDPELNAKHGDQHGLVTAVNSTIPAVVVKADEEGEIARDTRKILLGDAYVGKDGEVDPLALLGSWDPDVHLWGPKL